MEVQRSTRWQMLCVLARRCESDSQLSVFTMVAGLAPTALGPRWSAPAVLLAPLSASRDEIYGHCRSSVRPAKLAPRSSNTDAGTVPGRWSHQMADSTLTQRRAERLASDGLSFPWINGAEPSRPSMQERRS